MVDIAKCNRKDCSKRLSCFRYLADSDDYGQYFLVVDDVDLSDSCNMYWKVANRKELAYYNKVNK